MKEITVDTPFHEKRHKVIILGLKITVFGFFLLIGNSNAMPSISIPSLSEDDGVCKTKVCNETAASLLDNIDQNINPCENFYQYACGKFIKDKQLQEYENDVSMFSILQDEIDEQLHEILNASSKNDQKPLRLLKKLYKFCMDTDKIEMIGTSEVIMKLRSLGGWPVIDGDTWNETGFDWLNITYKSRQLGIPVDSFIEVGVGSDYRNASNRLIYISAPTFSFDPMYFVNDHEEIVNAYLNYTIAIAEAFGAEKARAIEEMSEVLDFRRELAYMWFEGSKDALNISQLNKEYPSIPWLEFINAQMPESETARYDDIVKLWSGPYISKLESLLVRTPKRTIANYVMSNIALSLVPYLNNEIREHKLAYKNKTTGQTKFPERWQECIQRTNLLPIAVSSIYVREHPDRVTINEVLDIARLVKEKFTDLLQMNDWMDYKSQVYALAKLAAISPYIGFSEYLQDDRKVNEYYRGLELSADGYLDNVLRLEKFNKDKKMAALRKSIIEDPWMTFPEEAIVNGYYLKGPHSIHIPVATMNGSFFNKDRPKYMNYGAMGLIVGHEFAHAFDPNAIYYDKDGNYTMWLTEPTRPTYYRITDCVTNQYSNYSIADVGLKLNGRQTLKEDMSDIVGVKVAYNAYKQWVKEHGEEQKLPGINRSSEQLFWLSAANSWCAKSRPLYLADRIITYDHGPAESRVNVPFMNSPDFAEDYKCPLGSKMNPIEKCTVF